MVPFTFADVITRQLLRESHHILIKSGPNASTDMPDNSRTNATHHPILICLLPPPFINERVKVVERCLWWWRINWNGNQRHRYFFPPDRRHSKHMRFVVCEEMWSCSNHQFSNHVRPHGTKNVLICIFQSFHHRGKRKWSAGVRTAVVKLILFNQWRTSACTFVRLGFEWWLLFEAAGKS